MKLADANESYQFYSGKASDISRQLSLAALGIVWIFKVDHAGASTLPHALLLPSLLAVSALTVDLLQYVYGAIVWGWIRRREEKIHRGPEVDFFVRREVNWPTIGFFFLKIALTATCYAMLMAFMARTMLA